MKKIRLRLIVFGIILSCVVGTAGVQAARSKKNYMKNLKVTFDLKKDEKVTYQEVFPSVGKKEGSAKLTNWKISDASTKGYKTLSFTYSNKHAWKPKSSDVHKLIQSDYFDENKEIGGQCWFAIVDYNSGENLEVHNDFNVKVTCAKTRYTNKKRYLDRDGCEVVFETAKIDITITYPITYKGLCIGVGGSNQLKTSKEDKAFWKGETPFGKTSYYTEGKKNSHFIRVTK